MKFFAIALIIASNVAVADLHLVPKQSSLHFVTLKQGKIAEVNQFTRLSGMVDEQGKATLMIDLTSVDTNIAIRDERMQMHLFTIDKYPKASIHLNLDPKVLSAIHVGQFIDIESEAVLDLHGNSQILHTTLRIIGMGEQQFSVNNIQPLLINAADFKLDDGLEKLREIAKLRVISPVVSVNFSLIYRH